MRSPITPLFLALTACLAAPAAGQMLENLQPGDQPANAASGQDAAPVTSPEARAILERAAIAVQKLDAFSATGELSGGGSDMFVKFMPTGRSTMNIRRNDEGDVEELGPWTTRVFGVGKDRADTGEEYTYDFASNSRDLTWVEHASKSVKTAPADRARGGGFALREHFNLDELFAATPLERELAPGATHALEDRQTVGGVECDVVLVEYAEEPGRRPSRRAKHNKSRWFLGVNDSMPRKLERIHDTAYTLSLNVTYTDVKSNPPLDESDMTVEVPAGYEEIDQRSSAPRIGSRTMPATRPERRPDAGTARPAPDPTAGRRAMPDFELKTASGESVTLDGLQGQIVVLYYWGTWCVPCREYSPLVSALVDTFAGEDVAVYAPAFMESTPGAAADLINRNGYKHTLLVDADQMRRDYRVRVAPTIDVIDAQGRLISRETNSREESADEIMARVQRVIREELARTQAGG